eukprot:2359486-Amphidinium_carterae.1
MGEQPSDGSGKLLQVRIIGHSTPTAGMVGSTFYAGGCQGVLHLCYGQSSHCPFQGGGVGPVAAA